RGGGSAGSSGGGRRGTRPLSVCSRRRGAPSSAALTASIGSRRSAVTASSTAGMIVVCRSSGAAGARWAPTSEGPAEAGFGRSSWCLLTGGTGSAACRPPTPRPLRRAREAQHIRLHQVIPAAGPAHLDHVHRELRVAGGQQDQLLSGTRRTRH